MAYEIDFIGVGDRSAQDADAICFRWKTGQDYYGNPVYKIGVYDGGFEAHGEEMAKTLNQFYFDDPDNHKDASKKVIDFVCVSHPDQDHTAGIKKILESFTVNKIYMNRPWLYTSELEPYLKDHRLNLEKHLREAFPYIADIEDVANEKGIPIAEAFEGTLIESNFRILSPTKEFFLKLVRESDKTSLENIEGILEAIQRFTASVITKAKDVVLNLAESWTHEELRENVSTSPENESSIVLLATIDGSRFLLTGDAGIRALGKAIDYSENIGVSLKTEVEFFQVPHHGGRHNVSPSILNRLLGEIVREGTAPSRSAFASVAKGSDHPYKMVSNAFLRRGVEVFPKKAAGTTINHHEGDMPQRNWSSLESIPFSPVVEEWDD